MPAQAGFGSSSVKNGMLLVLFTAIISGFSIFVNSYGVKEFDSSLFAFLKNSLVAVLLLCIVLALGYWPVIKQLTRKQWAKLSVIGLIGGSIPFLLFFRGLQMTTGTTGSFLHKTLFIFAAVMALLFLKERLHYSFLIGAAFILIGNYFMLQPAFAFSVGHLFILLAVVFWAAENVYAKKVMEEVPATLVALGRMGFGSLFILMFLLATDKVSLLSQLTFSHALWIGITSTFLLLYVMTYYNGLQSIKVSTATSILALGVPITTVLNILVKGTPMSWFTALGMLSITAGIVFVIWLPFIMPMTSRSSQVHDDRRS